MMHAEAERQFLARTDFLQAVVAEKGHRVSSAFLLPETFSHRAAISNCHPGIARSDIRNPAPSSVAFLNPGYRLSPSGSAGMTGVSAAARNPTSPDYRFGNRSKLGSPSGI